MFNMKFGVREICDVVFKAKADTKIGTSTFKKGQPVLYIDTAKTSTIEGAATTVYATGGKGNTGSNYQGGAGIGAGYQGLAKITITGGTIENAKGGTASAGKAGIGGVATGSGDSEGPCERTDKPDVQFYCGVC